MVKQVVHTENAPAAIGTYSQAIVAGSMVFLSGQIPLDPKTQQMCGEAIEAQVHQVFKNLSAVCVAAGGKLNDMVKLNIYLTDLVHFPVVNDIMKAYFSTSYPARAVIGVSALPRGALVEMDGIMVL